MRERLELLTVAEMSRADQAAVAGGIAGEKLMEAAGAAVAEAIAKRWKPCPVAVLCGPGNNGGDGFVVARLLTQRGYTVRLVLAGDPARLSGDAALNAKRWTGKVEPISPACLDGAALAVDALFGAGLARPIGPDLAEVLDAAAKAKLPVVSVDIPSGVHGDSGEVLGAASQAALTVTFCRKKPGHLLLPGRALCGEVVVADIGITDATVAGIGPRQWENAPALWRALFPQAKPGDHKYTRGHAVIAAGGQITGAGRLAARGAMRAGAGMVSVVCPADSTAIYAQALPGALIRPIRDTASFVELAQDKRTAALVVGPGNGLSLATRERALAALATRKPCVVDADALSVFEDSRQLLYGALHDRAVITPHDGEFARIFTHRAGGRLGRARAAAKEGGAVVLFKGYDTVIAHPDGRAAINANAPAYLATAGAGDVLAGFVVALMAQGMPAFEAACAATWLHGEAARSFGPGLIAGDLPEALPPVLRGLMDAKVPPAL